ncbi:MAG TPA: 3-deoxy-D-manno-octulosonic acid kinase [Tahibacter sp.]|nr:3-deoxy-D-manno-octulosonic acid kinase [Tahibacter sp.]
MSKAQRQTTARGAILCDASLAAQAQEGWFEPSWWRAGGGMSTAAGGRGAAFIVAAPFGECVLRHYRRGGLVARALGDRYLWTGEARTRGFTEFRLLQSLAERGLPVPAPVAARYVRRGPFYRADLLMRRIPQSETLAQRLAAGSADSVAMARVGATIAQFHAAGAYHADLNAHNIMLTDERVYLIDFDRGELRAPESGWQQANLERLKRSLAKLGTADLDARWAALARGYGERVNAADVERESPREGVST